MTEPEKIPIAAAKAATAATVAAARPFAPKTYVKTMPTWKKVLVGVGVVLLLVGVVAMFVETPEEITTGSGAAGVSGPGSTLVPGLEGSEGGAGETAEPTEKKFWSEAFLKFGFSFFVGFVLGYAARAFLKLVVIFAGILAAFLFLMSHYGFVTVEWGKMEIAFNDFTKAVQGQFGTVKDFVTGSLPNAGLAGLGLFTGFKKNG